MGIERPRLPRGGRAHLTRSRRARCRRARRRHAHEVPRAQRRRPRRQAAPRQAPARGRRAPREAGPRATKDNVGAGSALVPYAARRQRDGDAHVASGSNRACRRLARSPLADDASRPTSAARRSIPSSPRPLTAAWAIRKVFVTANDERVTLGARRTTCAAPPRERAPTSRRSRDTAAADLRASSRARLAADSARLDS